MKLLHPKANVFLAAAEEVFSQQEVYENEHCCCLAIGKVVGKSYPNTEEYQFFRHEYYADSKGGIFWWEDFPFDYESRILALLFCWAKLTYRP